MVPEASSRERRAEIRRMRQKVVIGKVTDLKTFKQLKKIDDLLTHKIKMEDEEASKKPKGSGGPKGVA